VGTLWAGAERSRPAALRVGGGVLVLERL